MLACDIGMRKMLCGQLALAEYESLCFLTSLSTYLNAQLLNRSLLPGCGTACPSNRLRTLYFKLGLCGLFSSDLDFAVAVSLRDNSWQQYAAGTTLAAGNRRLVRSFLLPAAIQRAQEFCVLAVFAHVAPTVHAVG